jgi:ubiquinone/menaquinone biosynthesis C-methylase UbiE
MKKDKPAPTKNSLSGCCGSPPGESVPVQLDEIREGVKEMYAQRAQTYDSCCGSGYAETIYPAEMLSTTNEDTAGFSLGCGDPISAARLRPGETVLDLGSGGGLDCFLAAGQVGSSGYVIGVDMTTEMLERACSSASEMGSNNVEFRQGYLEALPVEDSSIDVVISNCVINLSPDKPMVFAEIFRVLKPGGRISISDIVTAGELPQGIKNDMAAWGACMAGALDMDEYTLGLRSAGFRDIKLMPRDQSGVETDRIPPGTLFSAGILASKPD